MTDHTQLENALKDSLASQITAVSKTTSKPGNDTPFAQWHDIARLVVEVAQQCPMRVIGISGSQGSGKSTLADILARTFLQRQIAAVASSLDDYYLTLAERQILAETVHPLLRTRGVPGTHDSQMLATLLANLHCDQDPVSLSIPTFDKSIDDRAQAQTVVTELLILEGWCLGVIPQSQTELATACNALEEEHDQSAAWRTWVNAQIAEHYAPLWEQVDLWIHLRVPSFTQVVEWRTEQEQQLPAERRMNATELIRFVQHYERLTRWMWQAPAAGPGIIVSLDEHHNVSEITLATT